MSCALTAQARKSLLRSDLTYVLKLDPPHPKKALRRRGVLPLCGMGKGELNQLYWERDCLSPLQL